MLKIKIVNNTYKDYYYYKNVNSILNTSSCIKSLKPKTNQKNDRR